MGADLIDQNHLKTDKESSQIKSILSHGVIYSLRHSHNFFIICSAFSKSGPQRNYNLRHIFDITETKVNTQVSLVQKNHLW